MTSDATATARIASVGGTTEPTKATTAENPNSVLGQNDFLKLMVAQLEAQNPLEPGNSNEYINEITQFTEVEQMTNLASTGVLTGAVQLIGHTVSYTSSSGTPTKGKVESVQTSAEGTTVTVEGVPGIKLASITEVD